ncbi:MAG: hypothetical protein ACLFVB_06100 [Thermoplasmata archaeon]
MQNDKYIGFKIMLYFVITTVLFLLVYWLTKFIYDDFVFQSCFISAIGGFILLYLFLWVKEDVLVNKEKEPAFGKSSNTSKVEENKKVSMDDIDNKKVKVGKESNKKKYSLLDKIKGKKTCDNCGTELEYKESFDSYYCPECHEYK